MGLRSAVMSFLHCMVPCDDPRPPALPSTSAAASTSTDSTPISSHVRPFPRSGRIPESPILPRAASSHPSNTMVAATTGATTATASTPSTAAFRPPRSRLFAPKCIYNVNEPA